jgi:hypothetical protein
MLKSPFLWEYVSVPLLMIYCCFLVYYSVYLINHAIFLFVVFILGQNPNNLCTKKELLYNYETFLQNNVPLKRYLTENDKTLRYYSAAQYDYLINHPLLFLLSFIYFFRRIRTLLYKTIILFFNNKEFIVSYFFLFRLFFSVLYIIWITIDEVSMMGIKYNDIFFKSVNFLNDIKDRIFFKKYKILNNFKKEFKIYILENKHKFFWK